jgi:hypothetical protein
VAGERSSGDALIRTTLRGVWPSLPALTVGSVAVCAGAVAPVLVAPGVNPVAAIVAAVTVAPPAAALVASVNELAFGDDATIRTWWRALRSLWRRAIGSALAVAVAISLFLAAHEAVRATGSPWFWPSFAMTGAAAVLAVLALTAAMPLAAARPEMRGRSLWLTALAVVAHRPTRFVAVGSAVAAGVWAAAAWTASLLLLVPAPAAIVAVTATWTSLIDHVKEPERDDPAARGAGRRIRRVRAGGPRDD